MNQSWRLLTLYHGTRIGRRPQVGHFQRAAFAIIQQKRRIGYRGGSLALEVMTQRKQRWVRRQRRMGDTAEGRKGGRVQKSRQPRKSSRLPDLYFLLGLITTTQDRC